MNAKEMNRIATETLLRKAREKQEKANKYMEEKIMPQMEINARLGEMGIKFYYDAYIDATCVVARLLDLGYEAKVKGMAIVINWENAGE